MFEPTRALISMAQPMEMFLNGNANVSFVINGLANQIFIVNVKPNERRVINVKTMRANIQWSNLANVTVNSECNVKRPFKQEYFSICTAKVQGLMIVQTKGYTK